MREGEITFSDYESTKLIAFDIDHAVAIGFWFQNYKNNKALIAYFNDINLDADVKEQIDKIKCITKDNLEKSLYTKIMVIGGNRTL